MNLLVTGGAGFIGSNLADALIDAGHNVTIIDDLSTGRKENVPQKAEFHKLEISSPVVDKIFERGEFEMVFHLAAQMDVRKSVQNPIFDADVNILGGINLLQASVKHGVKKFIFSSTGGAVYGEQEYFPADEKHPGNPISPYGVSKLALEKYLYYYWAEYKIPFISLRYANVYGPRQNEKGEAGVVAIFCSRLLRGEKAVVNGDGLQTRDFVYVDDVVNSNLLAMRHDENGYFNVGTGLETDINTIFEMIKAATGSKQERINGPGKPGEQKRSCITYELIKKELGWSPSVSLDEGIQKTVDYFKSKLKIKV
ncbi:MAG: NAD-dependent epimerase/dehydratase family protein [Candidatus Zixiibacteriota bacterium]|nr:MAG: NAD-dependent epimerase/dehydratase family protein [candidate division Zixibacteria bacterium]